MSLVPQQRPTVEARTVTPGMRVVLADDEGALPALITDACVDDALVRLSYSTGARKGRCQRGLSERIHLAD